MVEFDGFGHINIITDDLEKAADYYVGLLGAKKVQKFPHFKNVGFSKSAGFLNRPEEVDVSIYFLEIPNAGVFIELFEYHNPPGDQTIHFHKTNDMGGPRHICLRVKDIDKAFDYVKNYKDVRLINPSTEYQAFKIDDITPINSNLPTPHLKAALAKSKKSVTRLEELVTSTLLTDTVFNGNSNRAMRISAVNLFCDVPVIE